MALKIIPLVAILASVCIALVSCGGELSGNSTCSEYLQASSQDQQQIVGKLVSQLHADPSLVTPLGFPEVAYQCGSNPSQTLASVIKSVHD